MAERQRISKGHRAMTPSALDKFVAEAMKTKEHLWLAMAAFRLPDEALKDLDHASPNLDAENLLSITVGCFVCEIELRKGLAGTICPGPR